MSLPASAGVDYPVFHSVQTRVLAGLVPAKTRGGLSLIFRN